MSADEIFIVTLLVVCAALIGWMSIKSHRDDAARRAAEAAKAAQSEPTSTERA